MEWEHSLLSFCPAMKLNYYQLLFIIQWNGLLFIIHQWNVDEIKILSHSHAVKLSSVLNIWYLHKALNGICIFIYRLLEYSPRSGGLRVKMFAVNIVQLTEANLLY